MTFLLIDTVFSYLGQVKINSSPPPPQEESINDDKQ